MKPSYGAAGRWDRRGCATWAPKSANRQGEEQHRHIERGSHTKRDKGEHSKQGGGEQQGQRGNQNNGNREPEWSGWQSVRMGGSDNKGDGLASQPRRYRVPGQPLLNRHQLGGASRSPDGLFAQQEWEPIRGRPAVRGTRTYGGQPGQRVEKQLTWASRAQKHSEAGYGRPVDRGAWTAKTVKPPRQQPAHPQYANYWATLTRKRHTPPHSAQPQHTNYWALRTRKRHQQEHRPQRPTESSDSMQHAKGRTGDCPGPRKGTTTRRNVTQVARALARRQGDGGAGSGSPCPPSPHQGGTSNDVWGFARLPARAQVSELATHESKECHDIEHVHDTLYEDAAGHGCDWYQVQISEGSDPADTCDTAARRACPLVCNTATLCFPGEGIGSVLHTEVCPPSRAPGLRRLSAGGRTCAVEWRLRPQVATG